jgi:hypothetical protein
MNLPSPSLWGETILHPNAKRVKQRYLLEKVHYTPYGTISDNMIFLLWSGMGWADIPHSTPRRSLPQLVNAEWAWLR